LDIVCISRSANDLGESPHWDAEAQRLYWIDAWKSTVHVLDPAQDVTHSIDLTTPLGGLPIGSIACRARGGLIGAIKGGFYRIDLEACSAQLITAAEADRPSTNRLNDGKCDRAGRFWCASVAARHGQCPCPDAGWPDRGQRHRLEPR